MSPTAPGIQARALGNAGADRVRRLRTRQQLKLPYLTALPRKPWSGRTAETGQMAKARMDYLSGGYRCRGRLENLRRRPTQRCAESIMKYGYHKSAAHYLNGLRALDMPADGFAWVFVEKQPPHAIGLYFASPEMIYAGENDMRRYLATYAQCMKTNIWPSYPGDFATIELPEWAQE